MKQLHDHLSPSNEKRKHFFADQASLTNKPTQLTEAIFLRYLTDYVKDDMQ